MSETQEKRQELRKTLKRKLLDRVLSNDSNDSVHALVALNNKLARMRAMREIPDDHARELALIRQEEDYVRELSKALDAQGISGEFNVREPRAIRQLNLLERMRGHEGQRWSARQDDLGQIMNLLHTPSPSGAIN